MRKPARAALALAGSVHCLSVLVSRDLAGPGGTGQDGTGRMFPFCSHPKAAERDRRHTRIVVDGVPASGTAESNLGPFGDATLDLELGLAEGSEITTTPENARLIVRRASDGGVMYDSAERLP